MPACDLLLIVEPVLIIMPPLPDMNIAISSEKTRDIFPTGRML